MDLLINSPFEKITETISSLREKKNNGKDALAWIDEAIRFGKGFITNLYFERILVFQHMVMEEDSKPDDKKNLKKRGQALAKMEAATLAALEYIGQNKLKEWESRAYRFLGRLKDYRGRYQEASVAYKKAIPLSYFDPEYVEKGVPRWLELEGFLPFSLIMSGKPKEGLIRARRTLVKYVSDREAKLLKTKDYYTWAVWKSGVAIRVVGALLARNYVLDRKEVGSWIAETEKDIMPPKSIKIWGDFSARRAELAALKRKLQEIN